MNLNKPFKLHNDDCINVLKDMDDNSIDSIVTDPPYGLSKEPDPYDVLKKWVTEEDYEHKHRGFMNNQWDSFVPPPRVWKECLRVLKPGGHIVCFSSARTYDWMCMSIRIAGFEIRDQIMWIYGTGMAQGMNIGKAIDKQGGGKGMHTKARKELAKEIRNKREGLNITRKELAKWFPEYSHVTENWERLDKGFRVPTEQAYQVLVDKLGIHDKWRDMVRAEDLRRKKENVSTDRRNIEGVYNLGHSGTEYECTTDNAIPWKGWNTKLKPAHEPIILARKPVEKGLSVATNTMKHGTGGINIDDCRVPLQEEGEDSRLGGKGTWKTDHAAKNVYGDYSGEKVGSSEQGRFPANVVLDGSEEVTEHFPQSQSGRMTSEHKTNNKRNLYGKYDNNKAQISKTYEASSGTAARFFYCAKASKKDRSEGLDEYGIEKNHHVTVKPTSLCEYLCRLITPKGGTILDPFMGSGSTGKAAMYEGFKFIGIELDTEEGYFDIATARIDHAWKNSDNYTEETPEQDIDNQIYEVKGLFKKR